MGGRVRVGVQVEISVSGGRESITRRSHQLRTIAIHGMSRIVGIVQTTSFQVINRGTEALLLGQLQTRTNVSQRFHHGRRAQGTPHDILHAVVRHQMMGDTSDGHTHGLLHQSRVLEAVGIHQRTDKGPFDLRLMCPVTSKRAGTRCRGRGVTLTVMSGVGLSRSGGGHRSTVGLFHGPFLLAGRERLLELTVDEEVAENATGTPGDTIGPAFDTGRVLLVDEDTATADEMASFAVVRSAGDMMEDTGQAGFEEDEGILGGRDIAGEGGFQHRGVVDHGGGGGGVWCSSSRWCGIVWYEGCGEREKKVKWIKVGPPQIKVSNEIRYGIRYSGIV